MREQLIIFCVGRWFVSTHDGVVEGGLDGAQTNVLCGRNNARAGKQAPFSLYTVPHHQMAPCLLGNGKIQYSRTGPWISI